MGKVYKMFDTWLELVFVIKIYDEWVVFAVKPLLLFSVSFNKISSNFV